MTTNYDFNNYQKDALEKPRDKAWENWAKFENVGDMVQGFIRDVFHRPGEGQFPTQRGLTLEQPNGELINVGIKHVDFVLKRTDDVKLGDPITIVLEKEIPPTVKGHNPTKSYGFYSKALPENAANKTVRQLELEDQNLVEQAASNQAAADEAEMDQLVTGNDVPFEDGKAVEPVTPVAATTETAEATAPVEPTA